MLVDYRYKSTELGLKKLFILISQCTVNGLFSIVVVLLKAQSPMAVKVSTYFNNYYHESYSESFAIVYSYGLLLYYLSDL